MLSQKILITAGAVVIAGGALMTGSAFAQASNGQTLAQVIADKFHLNVQDVQNVISQFRSTKQQQHEANYKTHLDQLVKNGKITPDQEQLILSKRQELQTQMQQDRQNWKNMTPAQRKSARQSQVQDLKNWAKQNNIPLKYVVGGFGMWHAMRGMKPPVQPTPTS